jgi:putative ABC transport system substrate-binding protein
MSVRGKQLAPALALVLLAALTSEAQEAGRVARIGVLTPTTEMTMWLSATLGRRLGELGWVEGGNLTFDRRAADGQPDQLGGLAADLVRAKVDVIVALGVQAIGAAKDATRTIPIVMWSGIDPVGAGLVDGLARPGGNVTGVTALVGDTTVKRIELLKDAMPRASRVVVLVNPRNPGSVAQLRALKTAASARRMQVELVEVTRSGEYAELSMTIARTRPDGIIVTGDPEFTRDRRKLVDLAAKTRTPASYDTRVFAEVGGLMSYGSKNADIVRRLAGYVHRLLNGAKPGDLPIERATEFELVINLKTARALGLTIPQSVLLRADHVIE